MSVSRHVLFECLGASRLSEVGTVSGSVVCRVTDHAPVRLLAVCGEAALSLLVVWTVVALLALLALVVRQCQFEGCVQKWIAGAPSLLSGRGSPPIPTPRSQVLVPVSFPSPWGGSAGTSPWRSPSPRRRRGRRSSLPSSFRHFLRLFEYLPLFSGEFLLDLPHCGASLSLLRVTHLKHLKYLMVDVQVELLEGFLKRRKFGVLADDQLGSLLEFVHESEDVVHPDLPAVEAVDLESLRTRILTVDQFEDVVDGNSRKSASCFSM